MGAHHGLQAVMNWDSMFIRISPRIVVVFLITFLAASILYGQATGSISGTVTDATGAAVPSPNTYDW